MLYVLNADEMKTCDSNTINSIGIPAMVLMERAALATADILTENYPQASHILVAAGTGNNGGDGIAVGRILQARGKKVDFLLVGEQEKASEETRNQITIAQKLGAVFEKEIPAQKYDIVVDALLGIGLSRELTGVYKEAVEKLNEWKASGAILCAVDIPSGISADTGKILGAAVRADLTVTYSFAKRGHLLYPGKEYAGKLWIRDIGIDNRSFGDRTPSAFCYEQDDIEKILPKRQRDGNKGTFGKVLLLAGSMNMSGAAILCGNSILRTGCGMLKIITPECNREILQYTLPEAMLYSYGEMPDLNQIQQSLAWADVVVAGPGIGKSTEAGTALAMILKNNTHPVVLDADALNLLSENEELMQLAAKQKGLVVTPHPGELLRLLKCSRAEYVENREQLLDELVKRLNAVVVGKDAITLVRSAAEKELYINTSGNDGMATAGSGDVLTGIIGSLLAGGMDEYRAACLGVYLHGAAGNEAAKRNGHHGMLASDLVNSLPAFIH